MIHSSSVLDVVLGLPVLGANGFAGELGKVVRSSQR